MHKPILPLFPRMPCGLFAGLAKTGLTLLALAGLGGAALAATPSMNMPVGSLPSAIALNPSQQTVYVVNLGSNNLSTFSETAERSASSLRAGQTPYAVATYPERGLVYIANAGDGSLSVLDEFANRYTSVATGQQPIAVTVHPASDQVYVLNQGSESLSVLDAFAQRSTSVATGRKPVAFSLDPVSGTAYVVNSESHDLSVIDAYAQPGTAGAAGAIVWRSRSVPTGQHPVAVALNPQAGQLFVVNRDSDSVSIFDTTNFSRRDIGVGQRPAALALDAARNRLYVANMLSNNLTLLDPQTGATQTVAVGSNPIALAINPVTHRVYSANYGDASLSVVDGGELLSTVTVGANPIALALNPVTRRVFVVNQGSNSVSILAECSPLDLTACTTASRPSCSEVGGLWNGEACLSRSDLAEFLSFIQVNHGALQSVLSATPWDYSELSVVVRPARKHIGTPGVFLVVLSYLRPDGSLVALMLDASGKLTPWDGTLLNLAPASYEAPLPASKSLRVYQGALDHAPFPFSDAAQVSLWFGYLTSAGELVYNSGPGQQPRLSSSVPPGCRPDPVAACDTQVACLSAGGFWDSLSCQAYPDLGGGYSNHPAGFAAHFSGGTRVNSGPPQQYASLEGGPQVSISGGVHVAPEHIGKVGEFLIVVAYTAPDGRAGWLMRDALGAYAWWDGSLAGLQGATPAAPLPGFKILDVYTGPLGIPGVFQVFFGYRSSDGGVVYNGERQTFIQSR